MSIIRLNCPSCGASLDLDNSRDFAFCQYCGTKIILTDGFGNVNDRKKMQNYYELLDAAIQKANWEEARQYAKRILELDAGEYLAWDRLCEILEKSKASFFRGYEGFGEYIQYIKKALASYDKSDTEDYAKSLENRFRLLLKDFIVFVFDARVGIPMLATNQYPSPNFWPKGVFYREDAIFSGAVSGYQREISAGANFDKLRSLYFQVKVNLQNLGLHEFIQLYQNQQSLVACRETWSRPKAKIYWTSDDFRVCLEICQGFREVFKTIASYFETYRKDLAEGKYVEIDLLEQSNQEVMRQITDALQTAYRMVAEVADAMSGLRYNYIGIEDAQRVYQRTGDFPSSLERVNGELPGDQKAALRQEAQLYRSKLAALTGQNPPPKKKGFRLFR